MLFNAVFALEAFNTASGIDQTLRASVKRMALRTDFDVNFGQRRTCFERIAACARYYAAVVFGMDFSFHSLLGLLDRCFIISSRESADNSLSATPARARFARLTGDLEVTCDPQGNECNHHGRHAPARLKTGRFAIIFDMNVIDELLMREIRFAVVNIGARKAKREAVTPA
jgi:hypothetical protein